MKLLFIGFCIFFILGITLGQGVYYDSEPAKTHPDHPGKCWSEANKMSYSPGEIFFVKGVCSGTTCSDEHNNLYLVNKRCPNSRHPSYCKYVSKHPDLEFPACCPELVCDKM